MLDKLLRFVTQLTCPHRETVTRFNGNRIYEECMNCLWQSDGIDTGGFKYA
jgi:hypothetical protein